ncbi:hypothetical protein [Salipaludibacillus sp. CF4.18]|uniref:hypothetical protein n=1 Tax=Salipaludibacillus sp. CF4.18 TaxID=3373081 RepID=UPI003EE7CEBA
MVSELKTYTFINSSYWYPLALDGFLTYIQEGRAENLKESMNLFSQEQMYNSRMIEMRLIQEKNQRI